MSSLTEKQIRQIFDIRKQLASWTNRGIAFRSEQHRAQLELKMWNYILKHMNLIIQDHSNDGDQKLYSLTMAVNLVKKMDAKPERLRRFVQQIQTKSPKYMGLRTLKSLSNAMTNHNRVVSKKVLK